MASKESAKKEETSTSKDVLLDNKKFWQAFDRSTNRYRYIADRHSINALYLNRNLTYMRHRMSRTNQRRVNFNINSLLDLKLNEVRMERANVFGNLLTIKIVAYNDKNKFFQKGDLVRVEIVLLKKKNGINTEVNQIPMGSVEVYVNSREEKIAKNTKNTEITIPTEKFMPLNNNQNISFAVLFRVEHSKSINVSDKNRDDKKFKPTTKYVGGALSIFDKYNRCQLKAGKYDLMLDEMRCLKKNSPENTWEIIPSGLGIFNDSSYDIHNKPRLQFYMNWCTKKKENNYSSSENVPMCYNFMYKNNSKQGEFTSTANCLWCRLKCRKLYSLLKHLKLCHPRLNFTYVPVNNGAKINVTINHMYDESNAGSPNNVSSPVENSCLWNTRHSYARRGTVVTNLLVYRPRRQKPNLSEFLERDNNEINNERSCITGHNRLYYHAETCLPMHLLEFDNDSEGESDPLWLRKKTMEMLDEFSDVNEGEKELMKMWNLHVMRHAYVGDCQLPIACDKFIELKGHEIIHKNLYRNFLLHLTSLYDYALISDECVHKCIQKLQAIMRTDTEGQTVLSESHERQVEYWTKEGCFKEQKEN